MPDQEPPVDPAQVVPDDDGTGAVSLPGNNNWNYPFPFLNEV